MPKRLHASEIDGQKIVGMSVPVTIEAAKAATDTEPAKPATFAVTAYTGGALMVRGWDRPVVIDVTGLTFSRNVIANLDHVQSQRVGHVTGHSIDGVDVNLAGVFSASTSYRDEVVNSAKDGFQWEASVEVQPSAVLEVEAGETVDVNGQTFEGPVYVVSKGEMDGFGFVSHGADRSTSVSIAAAKHPQKGSAEMDKELRAFIEECGFNADEVAKNDTQLAAMKASFEGRNTPAPAKKQTLEQGISAAKVESERVQSITEIALAQCERRPYQHEIDAVKALAEKAIEAKWSVDKFRLEMLEASVPMGHTVLRNRNDDRLTTRVLEAAICMAGRLDGHEKLYDDQTLQAAHDRFKGRIGLKQLFLMAARANGYVGDVMDVDIEVQRAAFGQTGHQSVRAAGFSTISLPNVLSNVANKFLMQGWNAVDMTPMRIAAIRPVNNFQQTTTVSLTGDLTFEKVGAAGEIPHGTLGEEVYNNQADTYAKMLAITRKDIINDDLGALTQVPRRLGRGAALKLNDIFWTAFLNNSTFFTSGRNNVSTDTGALGLTGLTQADTIFMNQTDPDGKPLGIMPQILLVPTALKATALQLMTSEKIKGDADEPDGNVWRGRFRVESSPYMSNSSFTGYSAAAWYLLADPQELPVIEIAALNGRVEPVIETADADFNVLGVQMRGYSDVGVALQEYRAGVRADGSAAD